jgi:hypothetical protein
VPYHPSQGHHLPSSVARASTNTNFIPHMGAPFLKLSDKQISQIIQSTNAPAHQPAGNLFMVWKLQKNDQS